MIRNLACEPFAPTLCPRTLYPHPLPQCRRRSRLEGMKPFLVAVTIAGLLVNAAPATADPTDCVSPDGSACAVVDGDGASGAIPGGPSGTAGPGMVEGSIPGGPSGAVTPDQVSGCVPGVGCLDIPR